MSNEGTPTPTAGCGSRLRVFTLCRDGVGWPVGRTSRSGRHVARCRLRAGADLCIILSRYLFLDYLFRASLPPQSLPMNAFMMWMSGDQVGLYSMMMVGYMTWGPIQGLMATNQRFAHLGKLPPPNPRGSAAG